MYDEHVRGAVFWVGIPYHGADGFAFTFSSDFIMVSMDLDWLVEIMDQ